MLKDNSTKNQNEPEKQERKKILNIKIDNKESLFENTDTNENNKEESDDEEEFPIELIIARRIYQKRIEYLVKWKGYSKDESTWENMQHLIEDNCFEKIYNYENLNFKDKIKLLNKNKGLSQLKLVTEETIKNTEKCNEISNFKNLYFDFNPLFRQKMKHWKFGNLNDDVIDYIVPCQKNTKEGIIFKCFWKKRAREDKPRKPRYYPFYVIKNVDRENFHKAFLRFDK